MTIAQLHSKNFNDAAQELSENDDRITTYETLKEFAKENIDNDRLFLSIHILKAIWDNPAEMDEITILEKVGDNDYIVDYRGVKCHALFNWFNCTYYADDIYGRIEQ